MAECTVCGRTDECAVGLASERHLTIADEVTHWRLGYARLRAARAAAEAQRDAALADLRAAREEADRLRQWLVDLHGSALLAYGHAQSWRDAGADVGPTMPECPCCQRGLSWHMPECALYVDGGVMAAEANTGSTPTAPAPAADAPAWRVGNHYRIHVYEAERPVATFHDAEDAERCVRAVNAGLRAHGLIATGGGGA